MRDKRPMTIQQQLDAERKRVARKLALIKLNKQLKQGKKRKSNLTKAEKALLGSKNTRVKRKPTINDKIRAGARKSQTPTIRKWAENSKLISDKIGSKEAMTNYVNSVWDKASKTAGRKGSANDVFKAAKAEVDKLHRELGGSERAWLWKGDKKKGIFKIIDEVVKGVGNFGSYVKEQFGDPLVAGTEQGLGNLREGAFKTAESVREGIDKTIKDIETDPLGALRQGIIDKVDQGVAGIEQGLGNLSEGIFKTAESVREGIDKSVKDVEEGIPKTLKTIEEAIMGESKTPERPRTSNTALTAPDLSKKVRLENEVIEEDEGTVRRRRRSRRKRPNRQKQAGSAVSTVRI